MMFRRYTQRAMPPQEPSASSFAPTSEREQLMAAYAAAVYASGFPDVRLADVARIAGVDPQVPIEYWTNESSCLLDTVETATAQAFTRMAEVFIDSDNDCPTAAHHALATLLTDMANAPDLVHLAVVEMPRLGAAAHAQQARLLDLFCEFLTPGFAAMGHPVPDPEVLSVCLGGGIWETVRRTAIERRLHTLPDALPTISFVCISTFFGVDEALRVSQIPVRVAPRVG